MKTISIHDAKTNLSKYIAVAKKGDKVYIGGFGKPEVVLTKISPSDKSAILKRNYTIAKGKIDECSDSFSEATDNVVAGMLSGNK